MAKRKTAFFCMECGNESPRWLGRCPACQAWNTLVEQPRQNSRAGISVHSPNGKASVPIDLEDVEGVEVERFSTGVPEYDFVLGGGIVPGSIVLIGGEPGVGKSTLTLQMCANLRSRGMKCLYVSGEESPAQVKMRAQRLGNGAEKVTYLGETCVERIIEHAENLRPHLLLIDSIQTLYSEDLEGAPGNVGQVRECAAKLQRFAKETGSATFVIGHVTKGGAIAGPQTLAHIVDTVIYFENAGVLDHRILRATKNRFGALDEIGVFEMTASGLVGVENPSELFLSQRRSGIPGSAVVPLMEGTRPLLVEVQGLASPAAYGSPQRVCTGFDRQRIGLLLAVMEKRAKLPLGALDVYVNCVGGIKVGETAGDAAVAVALTSAMLDQPAPANAIFLGEVGLGGELRAVSQIERRLVEASRMGFNLAYIPAQSLPRSTPESIRVVGCDTLAELLEQALGPLPGRAD